MRVRPEVSGPFIWIADCAGGVSRHWRANGRRFWRWQAPKGIHSEPVLVKRRLIFGCDDGHVYCLDAVSGHGQWRYLTGKRAVYATPTYVELGPEKLPTVLVGSLNKNLVALDFETGKKRWEFKTGATISAQVHVIGDAIYVASFDGKIYRLSHSGKKLAELDLNDKLYSMTAPDSRGVVHLIGYGGHVFKVDLNALKPIWTTKTDKMPVCVPVVHDGRVYVSCWNKKMYCLSDDDGRILWTLPGKYKFYNSPLIHGGKLYAGNDDGTLFCADPKTGKVHWTYKLSGPVRTEMQVVDGRLYVGTMHGHLYVLQLPKDGEPTTGDPEMVRVPGAKRYY